MLASSRRPAGPPRQPVDRPSGHHHGRFDRFGAPRRFGRFGRLMALIAPLAVAGTVLVGCAPPGSSSAYHYVLPVQPGTSVGYGPVGSHHDYPAADVFAGSGCGTTLVSPVDGTVLAYRNVDLYVRALDNPAYRGGRYVAILGRDGVRYYLAHLASVAPGLHVGQSVTAGQAVGVMGESGDAGACHVHFGISPPCPRPEWGIRRGVIWPQPYLDAWRRGQNVSPRAEVAAWSARWPEACKLAEAAPYAADA